ncbi:hypothetical protein HELRODRAFT_189246 [Helobdella robusta]|uniref:receptor protein-tyrosine kinase n=1 Tax=Helobdella robusta TaxID=6412 RepID=T1FQV1_HELRO|nr:hypothetical protein HELRODRAFT_189246 [Helobdella robusta]ESN96453.1 hypothetical protein HELRODRAFT_189246 [Helobdella robusta]
MKTTQVFYFYVCKGTQNEAITRYESLAQRYTNCTYVDGNLELVFLTNSSLNLSFLSGVREVTGYVRIFGTYLDYIPLDSLRIIRGRSQFVEKGVGYSLHVAYNFDPKDPVNVGLKELRLTSLHEIQLGNVYVQHNNRMCYSDHVRWDDIVTGANSLVIVNETFDPLYAHRQCSDCDLSCEIMGRRYCWGNTSNSPNECCDAECIGGCVGPLKTQCWACKNFDNNGSCLTFCPPEFIYSHTLYKSVPNPAFKYSYGTLCVDKCPEHLVSRQGACVQECGPGMKADEERKCVECNGPCPKSCNFEVAYLDSENIKSLEGCTKLIGNIVLLELSFEGDAWMKIPPMNVSSLRYLKDINEITGYLKVQATLDQFKNLSFLSNLHTIQGRILDGQGASVSIFQTSLQSLGLNSLKSINTGGIFIANNSQLCFAENINWQRFIKNQSRRAVVRFNRNEQDCQRDLEVCHAECSNDGCWGPGNDQCLSCRHFFYNFTDLHGNKATKCVTSCSSQPGLYLISGRECGLCHDQCKSNCSGPGAEKCDSCKLVKDGPFCQASCPPSKYPDEHFLCQTCNEHCGPEGCTGPEAYEKVGGCKACSLPIYGWSEQQATIPQSTPSTSSPLLPSPSSPPSLVDVPRPSSPASLPSFFASSIKCLPVDSKCPDGYFKRHIKTACIKCHSLCRTCNGPSSDECIVCAFFLEAGRCVRSCQSNYYVSIEYDHQSQSVLPFSYTGLDLSKSTSIKSVVGTLTCKRCDESCLRCVGPSNRNCTACKHYKVLIDEDDGAAAEEYDGESDVSDGGSRINTNGYDVKFYCTERCPEDKPDAHVNNTETICLPIDYVAKRRRDVSVALGVLISFIITCTILGVIFIRRKEIIKKFNKYQAEMRFLNAKSDVKPAKAEPDLANLRLINNSELRTGAVIGYGAYGTVYKGYWFPTDGNPEGMPVAIKILKEGSQELLAEARIMASVRHVSCINILCLCLTENLMLVTPLMPQGCMLDYIRKNTKSISADVILRWSTQIAEVEFANLKYVTVESLDQVKITDFGLAKLIDRDDIKIGGESEGAMKLPVKWLAYECLVNKIFDHKSDVWSYGVTIWELCTFGDRPYKHVSNVKLIPEMLREGIRLEKPQICSNHFYYILYSCWNLNPNDRPTFSELVKDFITMQQSSGRYLTIPPDGRLPLERHHKIPASHQQSLEFKQKPFRFGYESKSSGSDVRQSLLSDKPVDYLMPGNSPEPPILYNNLMYLKQQNAVSNGSAKKSPLYVNSVKPSSSSDILEPTYVPTLQPSSEYYNDFSPGFLNRPIRLRNKGDSSYQHYKAPNTSNTTGQQQTEDCGSIPTNIRENSMTDDYISVLSAKSLYRNSTLSNGALAQQNQQSSEFSLMPESKQRLSSSSASFNPKRTSLSSSHSIPSPGLPFSVAPPTEQLTNQMRDSFYGSENARNSQEDHGYYNTLSF